MTKLPSSAACHMQVTVQVDPEVARSLTKGRRAAGRGASKLCRTLDSLSLDLFPLHPGADSENLGSYFAVDVPDAKTAKRVVRRLRPCRGIRAAYVKPVDTLP